MAPAAHRPFPAGASALETLAHAYGVDTEFEGRAVPPDTLHAVLAAMGVDAGSTEAAEEALAGLRARRAHRLLPRAIVLRAGVGTEVPLPAGAEAWVELEDGGTVTVGTPFPRGLHLTDAGETRPLPADLPVGRHTLCARLGDRASTAAPLLVAPHRLAGPTGRSWGFLVQLYSLLSERSWGMGDLADLAELARWSGHTLGAGFVQMNPLHAGMPPGPDGHSDPSPYRPSSRRFADPVHLRIEAVPEYAYLAPEARERVQDAARRGARLREGVLIEENLIDRDAVWAAKREALEVIHAVPRGVGREAAYRAFLRREGDGLLQYATWCALAEVHGPAWRDWPSGLRDPGSAAVARARVELAHRVDFHSWLAWLVDEQLGAAQAAARDAGMPVGLVHDLAVGVHPDGADAWALQHCLAAGISVGAPPDAFNAHGQDWALPPWRPDALADTGYAPYAELLRANLRHAGALRVDHVMGLFRLWWVPQGRPPTEGTYVRYDHEAMLGVLALEAYRAGAIVIGEDLGTVEPGVREQLAARGVLGTSVLWFERDWSEQGGGSPLPPDRWREDCLATLTTHDLPPTASRLSGDHVELRHRLGLLSRPLAEEQAEDETEREEWLGELAREGLMTVPPYGEGPAADLLEPADGRHLPDAVAALHRYLLRTPAELVGVWLPDVLGDPRPQNLPGTSSEYPNWRLPVADADGKPATLDQLAAAERTEEFAAVMRDESAAGE
ncbi:4-alpha-glucanotransferase [Streptacidiphilus jiangxiensis]|uniref:4-alpha-glucanotransferase n=1 Tax=Streptacidiphilus jiangxiensis TaxID=235985 RepID=A0A1H7S2X7_STRJI|nr:4-alpha-glucanotransferase [Streptacidiphilus jiangxiensis]SEL66922.1 4-alpha-glucanotransferase [Streptacidiphilus jiangxiensis]